VRKIAFFDFCGTLVNFQTANIFVDYVRKRNGNSWMRLMNLIFIVCSKLKIFMVINKMFPGYQFSKRMKLLQLRGFKYEDLDELAKLYYQEKIKPNLIYPVFDKIKELVGKGYEICIASAGYSIYIKHFAADNNIRHVISTEIGFDSNKSLGRIWDTDCYKEGKISRIKSYFRGEDIDLGNCISYSDSISDLPLLLGTGSGVVVSHGKTQSWPVRYNLDELIWK